MITDERRRELNEERGQTLLPELQEILKNGLSVLEEDGWKPLVTQAYRSIDEQNALYAQGRKPVYEVNVMRKIAGLDQVDAEEAAKKVTNAKGGMSRHNYREAFDLVNVNDDGQADWDNLDFYKEAHKVFDTLAWGGLFTSITDYPHFELKHE